MDIDYKQLLEKYMAVVIDTESHSYISEFKDSGLPYTQEEIDELWRISFLKIKDDKLVTYSINPLV